MRKFIFKPDITLYEGIEVFKDTRLSYKNENVKQELKDLTLKTKMTEKKDNYTSKTDLVIHLEEGDILLYEEERGYFLPCMPMSTIQEAIDDLEVIKDFDNEKGE